MADGSKIVISMENNRVFIAVISEGTSRDAMVLKSYYQNALKEGVKDFTLELKNCTMLDSTFLGVLLGLALKLKAWGGELHVKNASKDVADLMASLGLDRLFFR